MEFDKENFNCAICLDVFLDPVNIECGHVFCKKCIEKLDKCPECRKEINNHFVKVHLIRNQIEALFPDEIKRRNEEASSLKDIIYTNSNEPRAYNTFDNVHIVNMNNYYEHNNIVTTNNDNNNCETILKNFMIYILILICFSFTIINILFTMFVITNKLSTPTNYDDIIIINEPVTVIILCLIVICLSLSPSLFIFKMFQWNDELRILYSLLFVFIIVLDIMYFGLIESIRNNDSVNIIIFSIYIAVYTCVLCVCVGVYCFSSRD